MRRDLWRLSSLGSAQRRAWRARSAWGVRGKGTQSGPKHFLLSSVAVQATEPIFPHPLQRLLLQDLHDSHICNSLLVAESEEDIWKSETPYTSYRQRVMPTDGMNIPLAMPQQQRYKDAQEGVNFHAMAPAMSCVLYRLLCRGELPAPGLPGCHHAVHARALCL